eukprot:TRINITY_DN32252_c0_g1_i1.p1 TRINITY_DN32252_c0_g1~~TRINITY_DN32252_c0_g1_i1.p1  ORF type:complete len:307 (-),score=108.07 TRINITY_DN32252_c0_g1_i1:60-980(-)
MDRTDEFFTILADFRTKQKPYHRYFKPKVRKQNGKTQFSALASTIGARIGETSAKLQKLHTLAKRRSLFDDPAAEIQELTAIVNDNIKQLKDQLAVLGGMRTTAAKGRDAEAHVSSVVDTLNRKLNGTARNFSAALELRTESLKVQQRDRERFTGAPVPSLARQTSLANASSGASHRDAAPMSSAAADEVAITMPTTWPSQATGQQQLRLLPLRDPYTLSRVEAVTTIERTVVELKVIFEQLAAMVVEQGESIDRIDQDVELAAKHVDGAERELLKYSRYLSNNRGLLLKVFCVVFLFAVVFVLFL